MNDFTILANTTLISTRLYEYRSSYRRGDVFLRNRQRNVVDIILKVLVMIIKIRNMIIKVLMIIKALVILIIIGYTGIRLSFRRPLLKNTLWNKFIRIQQFRWRAYQDIFISNLKTIIESRIYRNIHTVFASIVL